MHAHCNHHMVSFSTYILFKWYYSALWMAAKRNFTEALEELENISSVMHTSRKANIHCVLSKVPEEMKKGKRSNYFDGCLPDDEKSIRVYGYDSEVRCELFESQTQPHRTILLSNCSVKMAKNGTHLEVSVNKSTTIQKSTNDFTAPNETMMILSTSS